MQERTLIILKPDCLQRGIAGEIISRFERKGLKLTAMKMELITEETASSHYREHQGKSFFEELVGFITSSPVILMVIEGEGAILFSRRMAGATKAEDALPGTIRGDYVLHTGSNIVHTSDSVESAEREINLFFAGSEIFDYKRNIDWWI